MCGGSRRTARRTCPRTRRRCDRLGREERVRVPGPAGLGPRVARYASRPGSWTAVIGLLAVLGGRDELEPAVGLAAPPRIRSARAATSFAGTWMPICVSVTTSWREVGGRVDDAHGGDPSGAARPARQRRSSLEDRGRDLGRAVAHQVVGGAREAGEPDRPATCRRSRASRTAAAPRAGPRCRQTRARAARRPAPRRRRGRRRVRGEHRPHDRLDDVRPDRPDDVAGGGLDDGVPGGPLLVGVPASRGRRPAVREAGVHRPQDLGRLVEAAQELVDVDPGRRLHPLPAAVHQDQAGAPRPEGARRGGRHGPPEPVTGDHDRPIAQQAGTLGDGDRVRGEAVEVVARPSGRPTGPARAGPRRRRASPGPGVAPPAPTTTRAGAGPAGAACRRPDAATPRRRTPGSSHGSGAGPSPRRRR